jgi:hypothetical protein
MGDASLEGLSRRGALVGELVRLFIARGYEVRGAAGLDGHEPPPLIRNEGFGSGKPHRPDVIGFDKQGGRIVFGLVRETKKDLDTEASLEEYNVYLDHNAGLGPRASLLLVLMKPELIPEFTSILTHYIHRDYWHRVLPVASGLPDTP